MAMRTLLLPLALVCVGGCTGDGKTTVNGTVTFDDAPIQSGTILFVKTEGGLVREGDIIKNGAFRVSLPTGNYKIEVSARKVVGKTKAVGVGDPVETELTEEMIPERYNTKTELTQEIKSNTREVKLELKSKR